jgi:nucleotide-binding universal stress UspA family protein
MMVVMALVTTFMTTPLMRLLYSPARQRKELEEVAREASEQSAGIRVVVPVSYKPAAAALVRMGAMLMGGDAGRVYALHLDRPEEAQRDRNLTSDGDEVLEIAQRAAATAGVQSHGISFVSRNIGSDIARAAESYRASWVVMGWHKPVFFKSVLGPTVTHVMRYAPANVAIFVDKGMTEMQRIIVPYIGEKQDRGALLAAERLGRLPGARVTILHVVKPNRGDEKPRLDVQGEIDREFPSTAGQTAVRVQVVENDSPIDLIAQESQRYDLMILGVSDEWNLKNVTIFGRQETIAQRAQCSLLIVHASPLAPVIEPQRGPASTAAPESVMA